MAEPDTEWKVLPHGPLEPLAENLWRVVGEVPRIQLERCMTVARTSDAGLALHSAIAMQEDQMSALEALGTPRWLIVPNGWHRLDAARYKARFPDLKVVCPARARGRVKQVVAVDGTYDDFADLDADGSVRLEHFDAARHVEGAMIVRSTDGVTLVFADSFFNVPHQAGLFWFIYGRLLGNSGGPRVTHIGRLMMTATGSRAAFRNWLKDRAADTDVVRLIPGHGDVVTQRATTVLQGLADSL